MWEWKNKVTGTAYDKIEAGETYKLRDIYRLGKTVAWKVDGLKIPNNTQDAHFTVHKGNKPILDYYPVERTHKPLKDQQVVQIITENADLSDAYALAMYITSEGDLEIPLLAARDLIIKPGEQEVIDLKTTLKLRTQNNGQIKVRPIITSSGIITMQLKTSPTKSELRILNLTT